MKKIIVLSFLSVLGLLGLSCSSLITWDQTPISPYSPNDCPPLPKNFTEADLIGTWVAKYDHTIDTLFLAEESKYKQIVDANYFHYESDWQDWWVESRPSGFLRLHFDGMRRCDDLESLCESSGGGLEQDNWAVDECENNIVKMSREVVLIVTGVPANFHNVPRGIWLQHARLAGADYYYTFQLEEKQ